MADSAKDDAKRLNLTPATFLDFVEELDELTKQKNRIIAKIRNKRKQAKDAGVALKQLDAALVLREMDPADIKLAEEDRLRYAKWLKIDLGFQSSLELPPPDTSHLERLSKFDAHKQGYAAALRGDPHSTNPHDPGTVAHVAFKMGWDDGDNDVFNGAVPKPKARKAKKGAGPELTGPKKGETPSGEGGNADTGAAPGAEPVQPSDPAGEAAEASQEEGVRTDEEAGSAQSAEDAAAGGSPAAEEDALEIPAFLKRTA